MTEKKVFCEGCIYYKGYHRLCEKGKDPQFVDTCIFKKEKQLLTCSCCGKLFEGVQDPADEIGFGMCPECGGDPEAKDFKKKIGWAGQVICEARFDIIRKNLSPKNRQRWDKLSYKKKCLFVFKAMEKGIIT